MKKIPAMILSLYLLSLVGLWADRNIDCLPIGPSKLCFLLDKIAEGKTMQTATQKDVLISDIVEQNRDSDVFIIGEFHDNYACHRYQKDFIEALYKKHPKIIVGFEFFNRKDNEVLELWRTGKISEEELLQKTEWYKKTSMNYGYTRLIMDVIKKYQLPTIGLNVPRKIVRTVSTRGFQSLSDEEKKLFPTIDIPNTDHKFYIQSIFGKPAIQMGAWFENIYMAQKCWDVIMAESMRLELSKEEYRGYKGVIIAGSAHVAYRLGIPFRYQKAQETVKLTTLIPVHAPVVKEESGDKEMHPMMKKMAAMMPPVSLYSRGIGDYVFSVAREETKHFPVLGVKIKFEEGKLLVSDVSEESIAEKNGLRKGDVIISLDGIKIESLTHFRKLFSRKNWNDSIILEMNKKIELKQNGDKEETPEPSMPPVKKKESPLSKKSS